MPSFGIRIHLGHLIPSNAPITRGALRELEGEVYSITQDVHKLWVAHASGLPLPDGRVIGSRSGAYRDSIQIRKLGDFAYEVYADAPHARALEEGMPERDLKAMLGTSHKVRISKDGSRYLIIPFRWGTPGATTFGKTVIPQEVHDFWKPAHRAGSHVVAQQTHLVGHRIHDRQPLTVTERQYVWGHRLNRADLTGAGVTDPQQRRYLTGMVNLRNPGGKGGASHSQYLTWRIMSDKSPPGSWIAPRVEGFHPARTVADQFRPQARQAFEAAVQADVERQIRDAFGG